jgi:hypothetical protein
MFFGFGVCLGLRDVLREDL